MEHLSTKVLLGEGRQEFDKVWKIATSSLK
jgi:hypothetical protein